MKKVTDKYNARLLVALLKKKGYHRIVVSPGSRNAPIISALDEAEGFETYSVPDERAAAFTALGMSLAEGKPAVLTCTSGSAAANYLPAITEAYFQKVPLIVITADRPEEWVGQGAGQTIHQRGIYGQHVQFEGSLIREPVDADACHYNLRLVNEALIKAEAGPVHLNVPFSEPLYDRIEDPLEDFRLIDKLPVSQHLAQERIRELAEIWNHSQRVLILCGQDSMGDASAESLQQAAQKSGALVFRETLSNLPLKKSVASIDRFLNALSHHQKADLAPDLLITLGGEVVSKVVKHFLREAEPRHHWHIDDSGEIKDTFHALSKIIPGRPNAFFADIIPFLKSRQNDWSEHWLAVEEKIAQMHQRYLAQAPPSDLKVFDQILKSLPPSCHLHCANSASIRYSQLFDHQNQVKHYANRGTSGIDGSTSTALGFAQCVKEPVVLITGDVAFLYDNAAFWNDRLPQNLKIIILNNSGGNIFRIIKGPRNIRHFERFQETEHHLNLSGVAEVFELSHQTVEDLDDLDLRLQEFLTSGGPALLEIKTPRIESPEVLADYFKYLKNTHAGRD